LNVTSIIVFIMLLFNIYSFHLLGYPTIPSSFPIRFTSIFTLYCTYTILLSILYRDSFTLLLIPFILQTFGKQHKFFYFPILFFIFPYFSLNILYEFS
jgi:hypothetical protein